MAGRRRTWKESCACAAARGVQIGAALTPPEENDRPEPGQENFRGLCFRDAVFEEVDFEDLSLPLTHFLRCRFHNVSFRNTDLRLSCLHGNDWIDCDFSETLLTCADLGGAVFFGCRFVNAHLVGAELRGATLTGCDFTGADLTGARLDRALKETVPLSDGQRRLMVDWRTEDDEGPDEEDEEDD